MEPKVTIGNYVSYMVTPWNRTFRSLGYHELDLQEWEDGEWAIIRYYRTPVVPALTPWSYVLTKLRNVEKTESTFRRLTDQMDLEKRQVWKEQEESEARMLRELKSEEDHQNDKVARMLKVVKRNDRLMNDIARRGGKALNLREISRHIPRARFRR